MHASSMVHYGHSVCSRARTERLSLLRGSWKALFHPQRNQTHSSHFSMCLKATRARCLRLGEARLSSNTQRNETCLNRACIRSARLLRCVVVKWGSRASRWRGAAGSLETRGKMRTRTTNAPRLPHSLVSLAADNSSIARRRGRPRSLLVLLVSSVFSALRSSIACQSTLECSSGMFLPISVVSRVREGRQLDLQTRCIYKVCVALSPHAHFAYRIHPHDTEAAHDDVLARKVPEALNTAQRHPRTDVTPLWCSSGHAHRRAWDSTCSPAYPVSVSPITDGERPSGPALAENAEGFSLCIGGGFSSPPLPNLHSAPTRSRVTRAALRDTAFRRWRRWRSLRCAGKGEVQDRESRERQHR